MESASHEPISESHTPIEDRLLSIKGVGKKGIKLLIATFPPKDHETIDEAISTGLLALFEELHDIDYKTRTAIIYATFNYQDKPPRIKGGLTRLIHNIWNAHKTGDLYL